jgi:septal ring factor EnvC (AmiA/AmiB activator)
LAAEARDLDGLVAELDRAADLRQRLAELPGPLLRPARPEDTRPVTDLASGPAVETAAAPPSPYLLPVTGRTSAGFGSTLESGAASRGVSLVPRAGAQVVAPAEGRVAFAGPYRGYGRIVIIEHPGDWISLVTGLARADVAVGDELVAGAPLGIAGAADPEVTLELRHGGESVNPLRFVG